MAEEEGFTFVDKRKMSAESVVPEPIVSEPDLGTAPPESGLSTVPMDDTDFDETDDPDTGEAPDTYSLLGYCLSLLATDAWQKLGLLADPQTGVAQPDLVQAKLAIDTVGDLAARLESAPVEAVPDTMRRELKTLLNDLRLNFVGQQGRAS